MADNQDSFADHQPGLEAIDDSLSVGEYFGLAWRLLTLDAHLNRIKQEREAVNQLLYDAMIEAGNPSFKVDGATFSVASKTTYRLADRTLEERVFGLMKERGHGGLLKVTVPWQTLSAWFKELKETAGTETDQGDYAFFQPWFRETQESYVSIRRGK